jgi:hypothetical protein
MAGSRLAGFSTRFSPELAVTLSDILNQLSFAESVKIPSSKVRTCVTVGKRL